ncbi:MAG: alpha/beta fold hydrolase, partial [Stackebrandtia sp.]
MNDAKTHVLKRPGANVHYDVRQGESGTGPVLLMVASPMEAVGFSSLAGYFGDRTVVTYDPRGAGRSKRTDDAGQSTPDEHAADLSAMI